MPSKRFLNLPEEKKQVIRDAVIKEFVRVPFDKVSINQIIHTAGISRGSFYTYFEDKHDLVQFLFEDMAQQMEAFCSENLKENGGDYFDLLTSMFEYMVEQLQETKDLLTIAKNIFTYQENVKALRLGEHFGGKGCLDDYPMDWLLKNVDFKRLKLTERSQVTALVRMGTFALLMSVRYYYEYPNELENARRMFQQNLEILKHGAI